MLVALKKDGILYRPKTMWQILKEVGLMCFNIGPFMLRALLPGFNPRRESDPQWMKDWIRGYARLPKGAMLPLVDTSDPTMPVPFADTTDDRQGVRSVGERRRGERRHRMVSDVASVLGFPDRRVGDRRSAQQLASA